MPCQRPLLTGTAAAAVAADWPLSAGGGLGGARACWSTARTSCMLCWLTCMAVRKASPPSCDQQQAPMSSDTFISDLAQTFEICISDRGSYKT